DHRILLDKELQGTHLKRWTLRSVLQTDIRCRALPWARLILESRCVPNDLNLRQGQRLSGALILLTCLVLPLGVLWGMLFAVAAAALLSVVLLNRRLYVFFLRQHGILFAASGISLHLLYYLYGGLSFV